MPLNAFRQTCLIFYRPHLISVSGVTWCGSFSGHPSAEKNIKKIKEKRKSKYTKICTSAFLTSYAIFLVQYLRFCHSACSVSFFHCSWFQLVALRLGHVLASNCDLCFGYLLNFANLHSLFAIPSCHIEPAYIAPHILLSAQDPPCNCYTQARQQIVPRCWLWLEHLQDGGKPLEILHSTCHLFSGVVSLIGIILLCCLLLFSNNDRIKQGVFGVTH